MMNEMKLYALWSESRQTFAFLEVNTYAVNDVLGYTAYTDSYLTEENTGHLWVTADRDHATAVANRTYTADGSSMNPHHSTQLGDLVVRELR